MKKILTFKLHIDEKKFLEDNIKDAEFIEIKEDMVDMEIKDIIAKSEYTKSHHKTPDDSIILFNEFKNDEVLAIVDKIRKNFEIKPILAVVTEHSRNFKFTYLLSHLHEEKKNEEAKHGEVNPII